MSAEPDGKRRMSVVIADDHTMFRQGLTEMLSTDETIEVVGEAEHGKEALSLVRELRPDVLLLDIEMPVMGAHEVMENLKEVGPIPKVVIVTMFEDPRLVREFLNLGASAYLVKSASLGELLTAVHTAYEHPHENTVSVPRSALRRAEEDEDCDLSGRELEVLLLAARGLSNRQAAVVLHVAEATIKRHLANIYAKLNVGSRGEATRKALSSGWISSRDLTRN